MTNAIKSELDRRWSSSFDKLRMRTNLPLLMLSLSKHEDGKRP